MEPRWLSIINQVQEKQSTASSWKSDQKSLQKIFEYADRKNLDPVEVIGTDICKLRTIIKEAKYAIEQDDTGRLNELFHLAATSSIVNLRLALGSAKTECIIAKKVMEDEEERIHLSLLPEEFERIQQSMRLFFSFSVTENENRQL